MARASNGPDVLVVGGGINGLVCAIALAKNGLAVQLVEDKPAPGGVYRSEMPFARAPRLGASATTAIGFVPRDLEKFIGVRLPLRPHEPSRFVPTQQPGRFLLAGAGNAGFLAAVKSFAPEDAPALAEMHAELDGIAQDLEPAWLAGSLPASATGDRFVRPNLRDAYVAVATGSLAAYVSRFAIRTSLVKAAIAADALTGSFVPLDAPGSAAALLVRHAARARGDMTAAGGPGAILRTLLAEAQKAGVAITSGVGVTQILVSGKSISGVALRDGTQIRCEMVVASADPFRLRALVGAERLPVEYSKRIDTYTRGGGPAIVHLALAALPSFTSLREERRQHCATTWLLPGNDDSVRVLTQAFADAAAGRLPSPSPLEITFPTASETDLRDPEGRHLATVVVPFTPYDLAGTTWGAEEERFVSEILSVVETFAPGVRDQVVEAQLLHPKKLETLLGLTRGHPHHIDDTILFGDRLPYATAISGLYACGAACAPAGGALGAAGWNAAKRILADVELGLERTEVHALPREE